MQTTTPILDCLAVARDQLALRVELLPHSRHTRKEQEERIATSRRVVALLELEALMSVKGSAQGGAKR